MEVSWLLHRLLESVNRMAAIDQTSMEEERILMDSINTYRNEMTTNLPQREDDSLFNYHLLIAEIVTDNIHKGLGLALEDPACLSSIKEAIEEAFMDMIDLNWEKCEEICRSSLEGMQSTIVSDETESRSENYWSLMKRLHREYNADIGEALSSRMQFVQLEYLDDRQDTDFDILMEERQKYTIDRDDNAAENGIVSDATKDATYSAGAAEVAEEDRVLQLSEDKTPQTESDLNEPISGECEGHFEKQLRLQMTWGRVIIYWKYWIDCRKESIDLLKNVLEIFDDEIPRDETNPVQVILERILSQDGYENFLLQFAHVFNKDFNCYKVLLRKLTDFLDLVKMSEYLDAFGVDPKDLFLNITTFQANISTRRAETCRGFEICETIITREQDGLGETAKLLACTSRPLLHLKDLLRKLSDEGRLNQDGIQTVIDDLQQEETDMSTMFSESLLSFLEVSSKVNDAVEQLRHDIEEWLPKREMTITKIKEIIEKLHKTTKDVAITQTVSSSVGIIGGAIIIGGLILAPFTLGASLIPSAIAGGVASGLGAATAIGAAVTEIFIDKGEMEKATTCIKEDKVLFEEVANRVDSLNKNSTMLIRYIPQDELESFVSVITDPQSTAMLSISSTPQVDPRIAINVARLVSVGGKAVVMPISQAVIAGTIAASRVAILALAHGIAAIGVALDIANLVLASVKLGKGARSENAEKLEEVVKTMQEEKKVLESCLGDMK